MKSDAIDTAVYRELQAAAGHEFVTELVDTFFEEAPGILAELRKARADGHGERFRRAAHSLKSNSLTFGAVALAEHARRLELAGLQANAAQDEAALDALEAVYATAAESLRELRHG